MRRGSRSAAKFPLTKKKTQFVHHAGSDSAGFRAVWWISQLAADWQQLPIVTGKPHCIVALLE